MSDMYRDPEHGAVGKRRELLGRRRDELATLPHAVRRVVVTRWSRIVASMAAWFGAELMVIAAIWSSLSDWIAGALPGREPATLSTLLLGAWALALLGYFIARSAAEHRFAVAMSRTVLPGDDVFHDLERLDHVHPDNVARSMAHRLEVLSSALPVVAAATIIPASAAYIAMGVDARGWPSERAYEAWLVDNAAALAWIAVLGIVAGVAVTRRALRLPIVAPIAAGIAVASAGLTAVSWWFVGPAAIAATLAVIVRRLRFERGRIQEENPAAGSEVFTLRGMFRELRAAFGTCRAFVRWHRKWFVAGAVAFGAVGAVLMTMSVVGRPVEPRTPAVAIAPVAAQIADVPQIPPSTSRSTYRIEPSPCGTVVSANGSSARSPWRGECLRVEIVFRDLDAIDVPAFPGLAAIPTGWHAQLLAGFVNSGDNRGVMMIGFPIAETTFDQNPQWIDSYHPRAITEATACADRAVPATVRMRPDSNGPNEQRLTLLLNPTLELGTCLTPR
jgi:hypothetical protein